MAEARTPPKTAPRKTAEPKSRRTQLNTRLERELAGLRAAFSEACEQFDMKVQARLADLQTCVEQPPEGVPPMPLSTLERALKALDGLKLKPRKGRVKDLEAIAEAVAEVRKLLRRP